MACIMVTGATGFLASHVIHQLVEQGHTVRGTVRSREKGEALRRVLADYAGKPVELELVELDLTRDAGWAEAMDGVDFVQHVASPFPAVQPRTADELVIPARDGALRALRAARAAGVKRVVLTSSVAAVDNGWGKTGPEIYDETCWTRLDGPEPVPFYSQSKTLAERAAWEFVQDGEGGPELAVINPSAILGPAMSADVSTSLSLVTLLMTAAVPACPPLAFGVVDVRDVARAHIEAMTRSEAAGRRFILSAGELWFRDVAAILAEVYPERKIPTREMPVWMARIMAIFNASLKSSAHRLGRINHYSNAQARDRLGIDFIPPREAILSSAESLIRVGSV